VNDDHLSDEVLSALIDQPQAGESPDGQAHLASCPSCEQRLRELRVVVDLLRGLPEVDPPRTFVLGPRAVQARARVVRLQRWYVATRALGASLAAVFVLLVGGSAYLDLSVVPARQQLAARSAAAPTSQAAPEPASQSGAAATSQAAPEPASQSGAAPTSQVQPALAPETASRAAAAPTSSAANAPSGGAAPSTAQDTSAPTAAVAPRVQAQKPAAAPAPATTDATPSTDQVIATTAVRPLPTLTPVRLPPPVAAVVREAPAGDPGAPLRVAASVVGVLAVLSLLLTLVLRHRLRQA
jgi:hypothetical protein